MTAQTHEHCEVFRAPEKIISETRTEFRKASMEFIERAAAGGAHSVCVDLQETREVDASGLGVLVLLQKRSKELSMPLKLQNVPSQIRYLLVLTRLDHLFEMI